VNTALTVLGHNSFINYARNKLKFFNFKV
jgi:hypothetical protein